MPKMIGDAADAMLCDTASSEVPRPRKLGCKTSERAAFVGGIPATKNMAPTASDNNANAV